MPKPIRAFVDQIEGTIAVLLLGENEEDRIDFPRKYLPAGCREGSVLSIQLEKDENATRSARDEAAELIERLQREKD